MGSRKGFIMEQSSNTLQNRKKNDNPTFHTTQVEMTCYQWEDIRQAVTTYNRPLIKKMGESFGKPKIEQEGVQPHEVVEQILSMAPGNHPHLGPLLLDLADKIKDLQREWH